MNAEERFEKSLLADYLKEYENFSLGKSDAKSYWQKNLRTAEKLQECCPDNPIYPLMQAAALIHGAKTEEAEAILKKYEKNHVLQFRNPQFRALFLYLAGCLSQEWQQRKNAVIQLQKLYQKDASQPSLYWYLARMDESFEKNPVKKLEFLEKQWRLGNHQNLLYMEVILTLRKFPESSGELNEFLMQCYIWAMRRHVITKEMGAQIARHAMKLKSCGKKYEYLLRECYQTFSTKELLAALCSLYIREGRTDERAAGYYAKGVAFELNLNNLHEYYMMATAEQKNELLPEPVLLYFLYHNTLGEGQKAQLYRNIVCYGDPESEIYEKYRERIEQYTIDSLLKRRISPQYAELYDHVLCPEIFTKEMAEAMADLMFLRSLTCTDPRIREVMISYEQLSSVKKVILKKGQAYVPIYSPSAVITLTDEVGNLYRNTISYQLEKLIDEKRYLEICKKLVKDHKGLLIHLCSRKPEQLVITEENEAFCGQIPETCGFSEDYRNAVMLLMMEYLASRGKIMEIPENWFSISGKGLSREQRGKMIRFFAQRGKYTESYDWMETYGTAYVPAATILEVLTALNDSAESGREVYYRLCYGCFCSGQKNYTILKYLSEAFLGTCRQMTELWHSAKAYGVNTSSLEERILTQMMFTGTELLEHFDVYLSYQQREPKEYLKKAYLTYQCREAFVKRRGLDSRFYFLLEEELMTGAEYAEICTLACLEELSKKNVLSSKQRRFAVSALRHFFEKRCCYEFMQAFGSNFEEALALEDKLFVEYHAPADSEVVLHFVIEKEEAQKCQYTSCRLYPSYGGVYTKMFTLFEGERITYFITEKKENGEMITAPAVTKEKAASFFDSQTRYGLLNHLKNSCRNAEEKTFLEEAEKFQFLDEASRALFSIK